jgi:hypothetical protein
MATKGLLSKRSYNADLRKMAKLQGRIAMRSVRSLPDLIMEFPDTETFMRGLLELAGESPLHGNVRDEYESMLSSLHDFESIIISLTLTEETQGTLE